MTKEVADVTDYETVKAALGRFCDGPGSYAHEHDDCAHAALDRLNDAMGAMNAAERRWSDEVHRLQGEKDYWQENEAHAIAAFKAQEAENTRLRAALERKGD